MSAALARRISVRPRVLASLQRRPVADSARCASCWPPDPRPGSNDVDTGGVGNDSWHADPGADSFSGGDGDDTADHRDRTAPVTITADGRADDGEAGEGDNVGADVEELFGGSGGDHVAAGPNGSRLHGGPGNDVVYADPGDATTNCEVAPDRDGDGWLNEQDCAPDNPAIHPGAGEIVGNDVDEDCKDGPAYFSVDAGTESSRRGYACSRTRARRRRAARSRSAGSASSVSADAALSGPSADSA
jgi:hypothetical protein